MGMPKFQIEEPKKKSSGSMYTTLAFTLSCVFALTTSQLDVCDQSIPTITDTSTYNSKETSLGIYESTVNMFEEEFNVKSKILKRLDRLYSELNTQGWDGYGAYPMETASYNNMKSLLLQLRGSQLRPWNIFPSPNGTFLLSGKGKKIASISVGNNDFSYAAIFKSSKMTGMESFNPIRAAKVIENILSFLEYDAK